MFKKSSKVGNSSQRCAIAPQMQHRNHILPHPIHQAFYILKKSRIPLPPNAPNDTQRSHPPNSFSKIPPPHMIPTSKQI